MLDKLLWIAQWVAATVFALAGTTKLLVDRGRLAQRMHWAADWPRERIKLLGLAEVAGAVGLIAPMATGVAPFLTRLAALCLAALMVGAARTHAKLRESVAPAAVIGVLCVAIFAGRWLVGAS